jgi:hypothetical protein
MNLQARIDRLEEEAAAAAPARRTGGWAKLWDDMRLIYGDGQHYSVEEMAQIDHIDPADEIKKWQAQQEAVNVESANTVGEA